jgi:hypothetical protein
MRKHLLLLLFAALCCNGLLAQEECEDDRPLRIAIGPKVGVGLDLGSHSNLENIDFGMGVGYQFGAAFNAQFGRRTEMSCGGTGWFGLQIEAMYGGRNIKLGSTSLGTSCIEVPVLAQLYVTPSVALQAGATAVMILKATPDELYYEGATYGTGEIKGKDVMVTAGLAYKARLNENSALLIDARYNMGMSNLAGTFDTKASSAMLSFSYLFNIVK